MHILLKVSFIIIDQHFIVLDKPLLLLNVRLVSKPHITDTHACTHCIGTIPVYGSFDIYTGVSFSYHIYHRSKLKKYNSGSSECLLLRLAVHLCLSYS